MMMESSALYLFIITNTDQSDKKVTHWWSFLDLHPKKRSFYFIVLTLRDLTESIIRYFMVLKSFKKVTIKSL